MIHETRKVTALMPHPLLDRVTMLPELADREAAKAKKSGKDRQEHRERACELADEWQAICNSIAAEGILQPLLVTAAGFIADGRHRWRSACVLGLEEVPVIVVDEAKAREIILGTVAGRRHFGKGAVAYLTVLAWPEVAKDGAKRKKASQFRSPTEYGTVESGGAGGVTVGILAARSGVSLPTMEQACELYRLLEDNPAFREDAEAAVWLGDGLGGILAGVKSRLATGGDANAGKPAEHKAAAAAWKAVATFAGGLRETCRRWEAMQPEAREKAVATLREAALAMPPELRAVLVNPDED